MQATHTNGVRVLAQATLLVPDQRQKACGRHSAPYHIFLQRLSFDRLSAASPRRTPSALSGGAERSIPEGDYVKLGERIGDEQPNDLREALTSSASSAASPGVEDNVGSLLPDASLPQVPESPVSTPRKRQLELEDEEGSPQTPNTRFRSRIGGRRVTSLAENRVVAYQPLRIETAAIQGMEAEDVRDGDLVAYLAIKYDVEKQKSKSYRIEMVARHVSAKLEEMYVRAVGEIDELSGYVRQLENVSDQGMCAIVQGSEGNIA